MSEIPSDFDKLQVIRSNQRYRTYSAQYRGQPVFIKQSVPGGSTECIERERSGLDAFGRLAKIDDLGFEVPRLITSGDDYVATSWAEGKPIDFTPQASNFHGSIIFFADSFARMDMLTYRHDLTVPGYSEGKIDGLRKRVDALEYNDYIDSALISKGFSYLYKNAGYIEARLTHADFTPGNVLESDGRRTLIDYESVSTSWPRFYDVVNLTFNKMVVEPELIPGCLQLIERYFAVNKAANLDAARVQMNFVAMVRALSLLSEHITQPDNYHNTQTSMTRQLGARLAERIERILADKPYFEGMR